MKNKKKLQYIIIIIILLLLTPFTYYAYKFSRIPELFKLNKLCQEEGYYMAQFEFKMLGIAYFIDKGHYLKASQSLSKMYRQMSTQEGLIKVPEFKNTEEEFHFYLNLQNPETGSFMDSEFPLCTHLEPTKNVVAHLERLSTKLDRPLKLKYPLHFFTEFDTPDELTAYLDDISIISWPVYYFPQTTFHNARDLLGLTRDSNAVIRTGLIAPTQEWKRTLLRWFYNAQDPLTGLWGPRSKDGKLVKLDLNNTSSIIKSFVDKTTGNSIYPEFPLRYQDKIFDSVFKVISEGAPESEDLSLWHEWRLRTSKGLRILPRYIWNNASDANKDKTVQFYKKYIEIYFDLYYVKEEGAFSYYPNAKKATMDGAGFSPFDEMGGLSKQNYIKLWGDFNSSIKDKKTILTDQFKVSDMTPLFAHPEVNSIRIYKSDPTIETYCSETKYIYYPKKPKVLDAVEAVSKLKRWLKNTDQTMGNWTAKSEIEEDLNKYNWSNITGSTNLSLDEINSIIKANGKIYLISYNTLSLPIQKTTVIFTEKK